MTVTAVHLARPAIRRLKPYSSARSIALDAQIYLDANESPWPASEASLGYERYPEPQPRLITERLAQLYGVSSSCVLVTRGADEGIELIVRTFCEPREDHVVTCPPTYGMYEVSAGVQGVGVVQVPLVSRGGESFALDGEQIVAACRRDSSKVLFLCSPNNPTGNAYDPEQLLSLAAQLRGQAMVIVDEAYAEFSQRQSLAAAVGDTPNLVVLRTLSKAWALAGARCGAVLARPDVLELLRKVLAPYPISTPAAEVVLTEIDADGEARCQRRIEETKGLRRELASGLEQLDQVVRVFPTECNFLLVEVEDPCRWTQACRDRGILIRDRSNVDALSGCVRISVGTREQNQEVLQLLASL